MKKKAGKTAPRPRKTRSRRRPARADEARLVELAAAMTPLKEIATLAGLSRTVLEERYGDVISRARAATRAALCKKQVEIALAGDRNMLIWLGKQHLGQADRRDVTTAGEPVKLYGVGTNVEKV